MDYRTDIERMPLKLRHVHGMCVSIAATAANAISFAKEHSIDPELILELEASAALAKAARARVIAIHQRAAARQERPNALDMGR
jgi:hypothetical protein